MKQEKKARKRQKSDIVVEVDVKKLVRFLILVTMAVLFLVSALFVARRYLPVKRFTVSGISVYDENEIVGAAGDLRSARLYLLDCDDIEEKVLRECPYLSSVKVTRKFPNRLHFEVEGKLPHWYIEVEGGMRYALDAELSVMTQITETEGLTRLTLPNVKSVIVGDVPSFGESEIELKKTLELVAKLRETSFKSRMSAVDLSDRTNITAEVDGKYRILLGDASNFDAKLRELEKVLSQDSVKNSSGGEINATVPGNMTFRPARPSLGEVSGES